jgi:hypothetical protein
VPRRDRVYCDACLPHYQREQFAEAFANSGLRSIQTKKLAGHDVTHGGEARRRRGATTARRKSELAQWESEHGKLIDVSAFERENLPTIQSISLSRLQRATGLSLRYVSQIRRGEKTPHPKHWAALLKAVETPSSDSAII